MYIGGVQAGMMVYVSIIDNRDSIAKECFPFVQSVFKVKNLANWNHRPILYHLYPILSRACLTASLDEAVLLSISLRVCSYRLAIMITREA